MLPEYALGFGFCQGPVLSCRYWLHITRLPLEDGGMYEAAQFLGQN